MRAALHTFLYSLVLGTACALLLTAAGRFTASYREANEKAEEVRHILSVLDIPIKEEASSQELVDLFRREVGEAEQRGKLKLYWRRDEDNVPQAVAIPFGGPGVWGPVKGYLSLAPDMRTIRDITFHSQEETPGLGGEIAAACSCAPGGDWQDCAARFRHQFRGKKIADSDGTPGIRVLRGQGAAHERNEVDGITGATMTGEKVERMLNTVVEQVVKEFDDDVN